ncbi:MAG TPA: WD40 repeat domain-containing protein [Euzebyales bacterium]|nr:WD40 repeat domain-containing protein [Euzebyales bacterium]
MATDRLQAPGHRRSRRPCRLWDTRTSEPTLIADRALGDGHIGALDYTTDGTRLLVGERAGALYLIDAERLEPVTDPVRLAERMRWAFVASDQRTAFALTWDERFHVVNLEDARVLRSGEVGFHPTFAAFSPDGTRAAVAGLTGQVGVLDAATDEWVRPPVIGHKNTVWMIN